jgi:hypothetical protein
MIDLLFTIKRVSKVPSPVLDDAAPEGYHIEERLQIAGVALADERPITIEFRPSGDAADKTPSEQQLRQWMANREELHAFCLNATARPFVQKEGKDYRRVGKEVQIGELIAHLDSMLIYNGYTVVPISEHPDIEAMLRDVHGAFVARQQAYQEQRDRERYEQQMANLPEVVARMRQQRQAQAQAQTQQASTPTSGKRR